MRRLLTALLLLMSCATLWAADNAVILTPGTGVTMRSIDVGAGVQSSAVILGSTAGAAIYGTAGAANANVITIQGIASGTTVPVTATGLAQGSTTSGQTGSLILGAVTTAVPSYTTAQTSPVSLTTAGDLRTVFSNTTLAVTNAGTFAVQIAANSAVNVAQINAVTPLMGNGVTGTGSQRVTIASDNTAFTVNSAQSGTWTVQPGNTPNTTSWLVKTNDGTNTQLLDPCQSATKLYQTISQTTNTQLFAGTSAKKTYVCHIMVVGADAENISLVAGTGSVCATNTVAVVGSTTAAAGPNLSANGGFSIGQGGFSVAASTVNADNICLFQSGSGRVAGVMSYVAQ